MQSPVFPKYHEIELPLLFELTLRGGEARPSAPDQYGRSVYDALADYFGIPKEARDFLIYESNGTPRSKWENMVRWARKELKDQGLLTSSKRGLWTVTAKGQLFASEFESSAVISGNVQARRIINLETFRQMQQNAVEIGALGEAYILRKEQEWLYSNKRTDLADRVTQISVNDVSAGYDILSFDASGIEKFIEVKTTTGTSFSFEITKNELEVARRLESQFWLYRVTRIRTQEPIVTKLQNPISWLDRGGLILTPSSYRVTMSESFR